MPDDIYGVIGSPNKTPNSGLSLSKSGFTIGRANVAPTTILGEEFTNTQQGSVKEYKDYFNEVTPINFFNPDSMNETRAQNQNGFGLFGKSMGRIVGSELLGGTVSGFGTLLDPRAWAQLFDHSSKAFEGNFLTELGGAIKEGTDNMLPIYLTQKAQEGFAFDKTWFWNSLPSVASTATALIPTMGAIKVLGATGKAMNLANKMSKTGLLATEVMTSALMSRHIDGFQSSVQTYEQQYAKYKNLGYDDEKAKEAASDEAAKAYRYGYANLVFDIVQWKFLLGSKGITAGAIDEATAKALFDKKLITKQGLTNLLTTVDKAPSITKTLLTEMITEGADEVMTDFYQKEGIRSSKVIGDNKDKSDNNVLQRLAEHITTDRNTWDSFLWGAVGGAGMTSIHHITNKLLNRNNEDNTNERIAAISERSEQIRSKINAITTMIKNGDNINAKVAQSQLITDIMDNAVQDGALSAYKEMINNMSNLSEEEAIEFGISKEDIESAKLVKPEIEKAEKIYNKYFNRNYVDDPIDNSIIGINLSRLNYSKDKIDSLISEINATTKDKEVELNEIKQKFGIDNSFKTEDLLNFNNPDRDELLKKSLGNLNKTHYIDSIVRERDIENRKQANDYTIKLLKHIHTSLIDQRNKQTEEVAKTLANRKIDTVANKIKEAEQLATKYNNDLTVIKSNRDTLIKNIPSEELETIKNMTESILSHLDNTKDENLNILKVQSDKLQESIDSWTDPIKRSKILEDIHKEHKDQVDKDLKDISDKTDKIKTIEELDTLQKDYKGKHKNIFDARRKQIEKETLIKNERKQQIDAAINVYKTNDPFELETVVKERLKQQLYEQENTEINERIIETLYNKIKAEINNSNNTKQEEDKTDDRSKTIKGRIDQIKQDPSKLLKEIELFSKIHKTLQLELNNSNINEEERKMLQDIINTMNYINDNLNQVSILLNKQELTQDETNLIYKTIAFNNKYAKTINNIFGKVTNKEQLELLKKLNKATIEIGDLSNLALHTLNSVKDIEAITLDTEERKYYSNFILSLEVFLNKNAEDIISDDDKWKDDLINTTENALKVINNAIDYLQYLTKTPVTSLQYDDILKLIYQQSTPNDFIRQARAIKQVFKIIETIKDNKSNTNIPKIFNIINTKINYDLNNPNFITDWKDKNIIPDNQDVIDYRVETKTGMSVYLHDMKIMDIPESGIIDTETAKLLEQFYNLSEGSELVLKLDREHEDDRYPNQTERNADPNKVPISVQTTSGIRIGFTNETYATHHNIVYFKKDTNNKLVFHSFVDSMTNNDYEVLQNESVLTILKEIWLKNDFKNYNALSEDNILKQTINKLIYINRDNDTIDPTPEQIKHIIAPIFYRVSNRVANAYNPSISMLKDKYNAFNIRMRTDFELVKELREQYANNPDIEKKVKVTNISTGQIKYRNEMHNIANEISHINGKIVIATVNNRRAGDGITLYPAGKINKNSPFKENRPINVVNQNTLLPESGSKVSKTKNSFVIVEANKGKYYALPIYQSSLNNSQHTTNKDYGNQLTKFITEQTYKLITTNNTEERDNIWKELSKFIRLTNKNTPNDYNFLLYYRPNNTDNSNIVITTYENDNGINYRTFYKFENAGEGKFRIYKTQNINSKGAPAFNRYDYKQYESIKEFIENATPIIGNIKRNTTFASYDEFKQALQLKQYDNEFIDPVTNTRYTDNENYTAYERFLINTGAYVTNIIGIKSTSGIHSVFFPNGSPKATLFIDTKLDESIKPQLVSNKKELKEETIKKESIMTLSEFVDNNKSTINFTQLEFLKDVLKQLNIDIQIDNKLSTIKSNNGNLVHASINNNVIKLYAGFLFTKQQDTEIERTPDERGLILAHEILHSIFDNVKDRMTVEQLEQYRIKINEYKNTLTEQLNNTNLNDVEKNILKQYINKITEEPDEAFTYAFTNSQVASILNKLTSDETLKDKNFLYRLIEIIANAFGINESSQLMNIYNIASDYINLNITPIESKIEQVVSKEPTKKLGKYAKKTTLSNTTTNTNVDNVGNIDPSKYSEQINYNNLDEILSKFNTESGLKLC